MDWQRPRSLTPSDLNDEAADLRASAAARRVARVPLHEVLEGLPQHFLLPAQGDPELWAVSVKVRRTTRTSIQRLTQCSMAMRTPSYFNSHVAASPWTTPGLPGQQSRPRFPGPGSRDLSSSKVDHATSRMLSATW